MARDHADEPFASLDRAVTRRVTDAKRRHAAVLARTDPDGRPLYRVTDGGNVVRTRPIKAALKRRVLERDGNACVECGAAEPILHIAHIEAYRINGNNDIDNLRTLCPTCHLTEETAHAP